MSNISLIHDAVYSMLSTLFTTKNELTDALILENNIELDLANGYGVSFEDANNSERLQECKLSIARNVIIVLTKEVYASHQDKSSFKAAEKALFEEHFNMIYQFKADEGIRDLVLTTDYIEDTGLQRLVEGDGHKQFITIATTFSVEYLENVI